MPCIAVEIVVCFDVGVLNLADAFECLRFLLVRGWSEVESSEVSRGSCWASGSKVCEVVKVLVKVYVAL